MAPEEETQNTVLYRLADLYADENTIHASGKNKPEIEHKLQFDNKLPIHYGKSTTLTLGTRHKIQQDGQLNISIGNTQLNPVSSQKLLGVYIDEHSVGTSILITYVQSFPLEFHF